jgi:benzoyl-CoA reductase/2-hydroxyglutaryl-CoA dehydratase subunit BcrC/BadD/HgdB
MEIRMDTEVLALLQRGRRDADRWAEENAGLGKLVVRTLGRDLPLPLLRACGIEPVAVVPSSDAAYVSTPLPPTSLNAPGQRCLAAVLASPAQALLIATNEPTGAMLFATLRELMRCGDMAARPLHGVDLLRPQGDAVVAYNRARLEELAAWAASLSGHHPSLGELKAALDTDARQQALLSQVDAWRRHDEPRGGGLVRLHAMLAAEVLPPDVHQRALERLLDDMKQAAPLRGERIFLAGAQPHDEAIFRAIEERGAVIVADDLTERDPLAHEDAGSADPWDALARRPVQPAAVDPIARARLTVACARQAKAARVLHVCAEGDEAQPWLRRWLEVACAEAGLELTPIDLRASEAPDSAVGAALERRSAAPRARPAATTPSASASAPAAARPPAPAAERRSRKSLQAVADFSRYQREWFRGIRERALNGEPFAVINADAPQEILRAFDIPFVVNQWWASIVAAKQQGPRYLGLLREQRYPTKAEPYSAQGLAATFDTDADNAPWGGLPRPQWLLAFTATAASRGIYASWAHHTGAELCLLDRTIDTRVDLPIDWWDCLPHGWDEGLEKPRLDLIESEFAALIARIEQATGRRFDEQRFAQVMDLVNEQEEWYRRTRDLIAACPRAPVGVVDTMPATMVPQWHRGTEWGRDAARALYDEVKARADQGSAACADERLRLMWVGRGLWSDMGFYQRWEASHGAVVVWTMYLALAADGYLRYCSAGQSPLRALAARFVTMGDELRMPTWAGAWHVREARTHRVDAAIAIDDADPLVLRALERAGIPVVRLALNNFAGGGAGALDEAARQVSAFLDGLSSVQRSEPNSR